MVGWAKLSASLFTISSQKLQILVFPLFQTQHSSRPKKFEIKEIEDKKQFGTALLFMATGKATNSGGTQEPTR